MIKALILDDNEHIRMYISRVLNDIDGITKVFETDTGEAAIFMVKTHNPQIVLLDIELPDQEMTGLDVARAIRDFSKDAYIIFIIGYANYALGSIEFHPFDYILKPFNQEQLEKTIKNVIEHINRTRGSNESILLIRTSEGLMQINKADIIFIELQSGKSIIHTRNGIWETRKALSDFENKLGPDFMRVHRSFIIDLTKIKMIREILDRSYEIEFWDYPQRAIMSRYHYQQYRLLWRELS